MSLKFPPRQDGSIPLGSIDSTDYNQGIYLFENNGVFTIGQNSDELVTGDVTELTFATGSATTWYRLNIYMICQTSGSAGTATATVKWSDDVQAQTDSLFAVLPLTSLGGYVSSSKLIHSPGGSFKLSIALAGVVGSPKYNYYATCEMIRH